MKAGHEWEIDIGSSEVQKLIVHRVGNKIRDERLELSKEENQVTEEIAGLILRGYLAKILVEQNKYKFFHETNLSFNEAYSYIKEYFNKKISFTELASNIAKHLYANSLHPNIKSGDLFIIEFTNILIDNQRRNAIGFFKTELMDDYFTINKSEETFKVTHSQGINPNTLDKGAVVLDGMDTIYAVDNIGSKSKYWVDDFLKAQKIADNVTCSKILYKTIELLSKDLQDPISTAKVLEKISSDKSESITCSELKEITCQILPEELFDSALEKIQNKLGVQIPPDTPVSNEKLTKQVTTLLNKVNLPHGLKVLIPNNLKFSKYKIEEIDSSFRIIIDVEKTK